MKIKVSKQKPNPDSCKDMSSHDETMQRYRPVLKKLFGEVKNSCDGLTKIKHSERG
jgi:hypothetical protein